MAADALATGSDAATTTAIATAPHSATSCRFELAGSLSAQKVSTDWDHSANWSKYNSYYIQIQKAFGDQLSQERAIAAPGGRLFPILVPDHPRWLASAQARPGTPPPILASCGDNHLAEGVSLPRPVVYYETVFFIYPR